MPGCLPPLGRAAVGDESWTWRKSWSGGEVQAGTPALLAPCRSLRISSTSDSKHQFIWKPAGSRYLGCNCCALTLRFWVSVSSKSCLLAGEAGFHSSSFIFAVESLWALPQKWPSFCDSFVCCMQLIKISGWKALLNETSYINMLLSLPNRFWNPAYLYLGFPGLVPLEKGIIIIMNSVMIPSFSIALVF